MDRFLTAWTLVAKQSFAHWRLLSAVVMGVVLATTIMSGTVVYFDALRDLALDNILAKRSDHELDILQRTERGPVSYEEYERVDTIARRESDDRIGWAVTDRFRVGKSQTFFLVRPGNEANAGGDNARAYFAFAPRLYDHATIVAGEPPRESGTRVLDDILELEAVIPADAAELFGIGPGDRLVAVPPRTEEFKNISVMISGVFERDDPDHRLWRMERDFLNSATRHNFRTVPFHISERTFMEVLGPATRRMSGVYAWLLVVDRDRLTANNAELALGDLVNMDRVLGSTLLAYRQMTDLDDALREYRRRLFFSKLPMFVVFSLIAVVILYYVAILSNLAVEDRKTEIALLRSRGATSGQIVAVFGIEGATIAIAAFVLGPLLAVVVVSLLGFAPAFSDLTDAGRLPAVLSTNAFLLSLLGGLLAFLALMAPAIQAARLGVTRSRQQEARPDTQPRFQRYYADVALLLIGILLLYQLNHQGSVVARNLVGEVEANQLFIILPGFIMIAAAIVILRLFPLAMKVGSVLLGRWLPVGPALGVWQMARDASHYSRLSLLLVLTAGLGIFAASFGGTLDRSFRERVMFSTGSGLQIGAVPAYGPGKTGHPELHADPPAAARYGRKLRKDRRRRARESRPARPGARPHDGVRRDVRGDGRGPGDLRGGRLVQGRLRRRVHGRARALDRDAEPAAGDRPAGRRGHAAGQGKTGPPTRERKTHRAGDERPWRALHVRAWQPHRRGLVDQAGRPRHPRPRGAARPDRPASTRDRLRAHPGSWRPDDRRDLGPQAIGRPHCDRDVRPGRRLEHHQGRSRVQGRRPPGTRGGAGVLPIGALLVDLGQGPLAREASSTGPDTWCSRCSPTRRSPTPPGTREATRSRSPSPGTGCP